MWTSQKTDEMVVHGENAVMEDLNEFFMVYFSGRLPTVQEISDQLDIPVDQVQLALAAGEEEGE